MDTTPDTLAALRAENQALRDELARRAVAAGPVRRGRGWAVASAALIVIGALLAPATVLATWANREVTSTTAFVDTFAPLARDRAVQSVITTRTVAAIDDHVDVRQITGTVFDGIATLDLPPRAKSALSALQAPAAAGVENLIHSTVDQFVRSDQFATLWKRLLRTGHGQVVASLRGDRDAAVAIGEDGSIGIQLGPIVAEVKQRLLQRGLTLADRIPSVDRTIVIATSDAAVRAQTAFTLIQVTALWLPWAVVACIGCGVLIARRRNRALGRAAIAVTITMLATLGAIGIGRVVTVRALAPELLPRNAARVVYDAVTAFASHAAVAGTVLAAAVAVVAWFAGASPTATRLRRGATDAAASVRRAAELRGLSTGAFGALLFRSRVLVRTVIAIVAAAVVVLSRPLSPAVVVWTLVGALVAVAVLELVARPGVVTPSAEPSDGFSPRTDDPGPTTAQ
jgi:hypothetical protein